MPEAGLVVRHFVDLLATTVFPLLSQLTIRALEAVLDSSLIGILYDPAIAGFYILNRVGLGIPSRMPNCECIHINATTETALGRVAATQNHVRFVPLTHELP